MRIFLIVEEQEIQLLFYKTFSHKVCGKPRWRRREKKVPFSTWRCSSCHHEKSQLITRGLGARNDMGFTSNSKPLYTSFIIWVWNSSRNFYQVEYHNQYGKIWIIGLMFYHKLSVQQVNAVFITYSWFNPIPTGTG